MSSLIIVYILIHPIRFSNKHSVQYQQNTSRHRGQLFCSSSHPSRHSLWYLWEQSPITISSPCQQSNRQIGHSLSPSAISSSLNFFNTLSKNTCLLLFLQYSPSLVNPRVHIMMIKQVKLYSQVSKQILSQKERYMRSMGSFLNLNTLKKKNCLFSIPSMSSVMDTAVKITLESWVIHATYSSDVSQCVSSEIMQMMKKCQRRRQESLMLLDSERVSDCQIIYLVRKQREMAVREIVRMMDMLTFDMVGNRFNIMGSEGDLK